MNNVNPLQPLQYDLHRFLMYMLIIGAVCIFCGISIALWAQYQSNGSSVFFYRSDLLGNYSHSPYAFIYNIALMLAGFFILIAMLALYFIKLSHISLLISLAGAWLGISLFFMGIFPVNYLQLHHIATFSYLLSTLMLYFFTLTARSSHSYLCTYPVLFFSGIGFIVALILLLSLNWQALTFPSCKHSNEQACWILLMVWLRPVILLAWCFSLGFSVKHIIKTSTQSPIGHDL
ncbi:hypothetical protein [Shewanella surugensis]|uniref:DUF998 domain-containing protein n=1 Tax=Shewanella surugensis TaxID=212020 RepID=A0ABT0L8R9_9GAMM|nr:hypothetical protein [Shewanella surugensis]MCL1124098.1 hypothetical protein [Shewanella surugensis]